MANIKPFKAYFYNKDKVGDLSTVVAPTMYNINSGIIIFEILTKKIITLPLYFL